MLLYEVKKVILRNNLFQIGDRILIGFSGGADSTALLHILNILKDEFNWELLAVHVNHGLRGLESDEDSEYSRLFCRQQDIPLIIRKVDVASVVKNQGGNLQDVARILRYQSFAEVAKVEGINKVVLGHHADDQVETLLMRLIRGAGTEGLSSMSLQSLCYGLNLIRPLLCFYKKTIEEYCSLNQLVPRLDSSNLSTKYTRNRIREELIPLLETYNPNIKKQLNNLALIFNDDQNYWDVESERVMQETLLIKEYDRVTIDIIVLRRYPKALQRRVIKLILTYLSKYKALDITFDKIEYVRYLVNHTTPSVRAHLSGLWKAERDYDLLNISLKNRLKDKPSVDVLLVIPGNNLLPVGMGSILAAVTTTQITKPTDCTDWAVFDYHQVGSNILVRNRKPGDKINCIGMQGSKKVKDLFIDAKISRFKRDHLPIVLDESNIIWIPGVKRSNYALVTENTSKYLYLFWNKA